MEKKSQDQFVTVPSKFGFFEVFNDKTIKKGFHSLNNQMISCGKDGIIIIWNLDDEFKMDY